MKKIFLILFLFIGLFSQAQIINPSRVNLIEIVAGGGTNLDPNAVEVTSESILSAAGSQDKNLYITTDFTLSGDVSLADNANIIGMGGVITVGANTITINDNDFFSIDGKVFIDLGQNGSISDASTFDGPQDIWLNWFGAKPDGTYPAFTGTDNNNVFIQASKIGNYSDGVIRIKPGIYQKGDAESAFTKYTPLNWYLGRPEGQPAGGASLYMSEGTIIQDAGAIRDNSEIIAMYNFKNITIDGGMLRGASKIYDYGTDVGDGKKGIGIKAFGDGLTIGPNLEITETPGSGIQQSYNPEFIYSGSFVEAVFTKGFDLDIDDGTPVAHNELNYSDRYALTDSRFTACDCFVFGGASYGGDRGMSAPYFYVAFYDNTSVNGDTTTGFLGKSEILETYEVYNIPPGATHARFIIWTPDDWAELDPTLYAPNHSKNIRIKSKRVSRGKYQGMSNMGPLGVVDAVIWETNGRDFAGVMEVGGAGDPGAGIDEEDGYENNQKTTFKNSIYRNNKNGDFIYKATRDVLTEGNWFLANDYPGGFVKTSSVNLQAGYRNRFYNNYTFNRSIVTGRGDDVANGAMYHGSFVYSNENETIRDYNIAYNVRFSEEIGADTLGITYIKDNHFLYDIPLDATISLMGRHEGVAFINNRFIFEEGAVAGTGYKIASLAAPSYNGGIARGWIDGFYVMNLKGNSLSSDGWQFYAYDIKNMDMSISMDIRRGNPHDFTLENIKIDGWLDFYLTDYPETNSGTFTTITAKNIHLTNNDTNLISGSRTGMITTDTKDHNLIIKGGKIDLRGVGENADGDNFFNFNHYGYTHIYDLELLTSYSSATLNLTTATGTVYLIDPDLDTDNDGTSDITVTTDATHKVLFTKAHPDMEVYADNAAAIAGGIPVGFLYRTSDFTIKMVN